MFSEQEIQAARRLREHGLSWVPQVGHYVFDAEGLCEKGSPFQENVYFILNYEYFMQLVGGVDRFKESMIWLPTWEDSRGLLRGFGLSDSEVADYLRNQNAIETGQERLALYDLIDSHLSDSVVDAQASPRGLHRVDGDG